MSVPLGPLEHIGVNFTRMPDGGLRIIYSTLDRGAVFSVDHSAAGALDQLRKMAAAMGFVVAFPMPDVAGSYRQD